ncbi:substrate-binding domain-containing protein [Hydrogenophaga crassostreae]|nr:substrate-binding domain-containing protein [Hydrogenophaga crassostreae]
MATRQLLGELALAFEQKSGSTAAFESVGGVDAAQRVAKGEVFDVVVLAADAIDKLICAGHLQAGSRVDLVHSGVSVAVRQGTPAPDMSTSDAVRQAVLQAATVGYSTGPSGVALLRQFQLWGIAEQLNGRLLQARPGVPVASMVASGEVALGFQQLSELLNVQGIDIVGPLPEAIQITTTFSAGLPASLLDDPPRREVVQAFLDFMCSPEADAVKRRHGMSPV